MKNNKKVIIAVVAIIVLLALLVSVYFIATAKKAGDKEVTLEIVIDKKTESYSVRVEGGYVIDVLNKLQQKKKITFSSESGAYGEFLTAVNGKVAGEREYYALYINNEYAAFGISTQTISEGDVIKIALETW